MLSFSCVSSIHVHICIGAHIARHTNIVYHSVPPRQDRNAHRPWHYYSFPCMINVMNRETEFVTMTNCFNKTYSDETGREETLRGDLELEA